MSNGCYVHVGMVYARLQNNVYRLQRDAYRCMCGLHVLEESLGEWMYCVLPIIVLHSTCFVQDGSTIAHLMYHSLCQLA